MWISCLIAYGCGTVSGSSLRANSPAQAGNTRGMEERSTAPMGLDVTRLRRGEITLAVGALVVLLALFAPPWYSASNPTQEASIGVGGSVPGSFGAWTGAGWLGTI